MTLMWAVFSELIETYPDVPAKYTYNYGVIHDPTLTDFSHEEARDGPKTTGGYRVVLPDGRTQVVSYTADADGYVAQVSYEGQIHAHAHTHTHSPPPPPPPPVLHHPEPYHVEPYHVEPYHAEPYHADPYHADPYHADPFYHHSGPYHNPHAHAHPLPYTHNSLPIESYL
ncbi:cuticle protein 8-like [Homarus americanus]|uniref:cuticle protein 8-like n=1 Tax=Homarus americanus TaxID=6706 RepID=UPI001C46D55A|nr:cuticle protein 8-like [Homarus americanus]